MTSSTRDWPALARQAGLAGGYGLLAGIVAALVVKVMFFLSHLIWGTEAERWYIFVVIMAGGVLIAGLRTLTKGHEADLAEQLRGAGDPTATHGRLILLLALTAIVAVAFGGAVGPEAGVLAVVAEMSNLLSRTIVHKRENQKLLGEAGAAAALSGIYGSPPGGAMLTDEKPEPSIRPLMFLAGIAGLLGFLLAARFLFEGGGFRVHLADYVAPMDGTDILKAIPSAILGGLGGLAFVAILPRVQALLGRFDNVVMQTLVGTFVFAALCAAFPILRFSGHHEMEAMLEWGRTVGIPALMALALLKALALALCLSSGWKGGAAFPLLFIGAAAGAAALTVMPATAPTLAIIAGMSAAISAGMGKPAAALLIMVFVVSPLAVGPLCVGALAGYAMSRLVPKAELH